MRSPVLSHFWTKHKHKQRTVAGAVNVGQPDTVWWKGEGEKLHLTFSSGLIRPVDLAARTRAPHPRVSPRSPLALTNNEWMHLFVMCCPCSCARKREKRGGREREKERNRERRVNLLTLVLVLSLPVWGGLACSLKYFNTARLAEKCWVGPTEARSRHSLSPSS